MPLNFGTGSPRSSFGTTTTSAPSQEIANVSAK
jgi:hypothetical protein